MSGNSGPSSSLTSGVRRIVPAIRCCASLISASVIGRTGGNVFCIICSLYLPNPEGLFIGCSVANIAVQQQGLCVRRQSRRRNLREVVCAYACAVPSGLQRGDESLTLRVIKTRPVMHE